MVALVKRWIVIAFVFALIEVVTPQRIRTAIVFGVAVTVLICERRDRKRQAEEREILAEKRRQMERMIAPLHHPSATSMAKKPSGSPDVDCRQADGLV